jgi:hypothetical protein
MSQGVEIYDKSGGLLERWTFPTSGSFRDFKGGVALGMRFDPDIMNLKWIEPGDKQNEQ